MKKKIETLEKESLLEDFINERMSSTDEVTADSSTNEDPTDNSETSLIDDDNRVAADLIENIGTAESEEDLKSNQKIIDEHNERIMKSPEFKAHVMYENYIKTCNRILDGPAKRRIRKQFLRDAKKGKFDYLFDPEKIAKREAREREKFERLNKPVIHTVDDIDDSTKMTLQEMAKMNVIKETK